MYRRQFVCLASALLIAGVAQAQDRYSQRSTTRETTTTTTTQVERASMVIGSTVQLSGGAAFGRVEDFVFSPDGCVEYVVLADQDNYVLVPWTVMHVDVSQHVVRVDVTRDKLRELVFTKDRWPDLHRGEYSQRMRTVFGGARYENRPGRTTDQGTYDRNRSGYDRNPADRSTDRIPSGDDRRLRDRPPTDQMPSDRTGGYDRTPRGTQPPQPIEPDRTRPPRTGDQPGTKPPQQEPQPDRNKPPLD